MIVDRCLHMIRMYSKMVYLFNFRIGCHTTVNYFTAPHLLHVSNLIVMLNHNAKEDIVSEAHS